MADKVTLTNLVNLNNQTTAVNAINANNAAITTAMDNTLSRDGTQPNTMGSTLDMNSNRVINLPIPASNFEPVRLVDAELLGTGGTITVNPLPAGGTLNQALTKNSSANFDAGWQTLGTIPVAGTVNQVLSKNSSTNFDTSWKNAVTSIGLTANADLTVTNSPVTTTGNIGIDWSTPPTGTGALVRQTTPTLNTPIMSQISNAGNTLTLPTSSDVLVGRNTTDTLTNKSIGAGQLIGTINAPNMPSYVGDVTTAAGSLTTAISANAVSNGQMAPAAAFTIKGNATGSSANPTDISIPALTQKTTPVSGDMVMLVDSAASNALKFATAGSLSTIGSVSSIGGLTGAVTLGSGLTTSANSILTDPAMIGEVRQVAFNRIPTNFLSCNGAAILRSSFASLFAALVVSSVVSITIASPGVVTWTGNQLQNNDPILLTTTGALPTGLALTTKYYVKSISGNTFNLSATPGGAAINTSGTQSGTHTATNAPWEGTAVGNGTTTFTVPNLNGYFVRGVDNGAGNDTNRSFGTSEADALQGHFHSISDPTHTHTPSPTFAGTSNGVGAGSSPGYVFGATTLTLSNSATGISVTGASTDGTHGTPRTASETRPLNQSLLYVIRYQ